MLPREAMVAPTAAGDARPSLVRQIVDGAIVVAFASGPVAFFLPEIRRVVDLRQPWSETLVHEVFPWLGAGIWVALVLAGRVVLAWQRSDRRLRTLEQMIDDRSLAHAILEHAQVLSDAKKDRALLKLREQCDYLLHTGGHTDERAALGRLALGAASRLHDKATQIEVLLDDLGWTSHLDGNAQEAIQFVDRAIEMAHSEHKATSDPRFALLEVKGRRHRALILSKDQDVDALDRELAEAARVLNGIGEPNSRDTQIQLGQIEHARALGRLSIRGLERDGHIGRGDTAGVKLVEEALSLVRAAKRRFENVQSHYRVAKALVLEERALRALGRDAEAEVAAADSEHVTSDTDWLLTESNRSVMGI